MRNIRESKSVNWILSNKIKASLILIILLVAIIGLNLSVTIVGTWQDDDSPVGTQTRWTCLFYFAGDNNLADYNEMLTNLEFLQRVGSTEEVHMVCLLDRNGPDDSKVLYIKKGTSEEIPISEVDPAWTSEVNMGDPETLTAMAKWTFDTYPADHQIILLSK